MIALKIVDRQFECLSKSKSKDKDFLKCSSSTQFFSLWTGNWRRTWHFRFHATHQKSSKIVSLLSQYITKRLCYSLGKEVIDFALADLRVCRSIEEQD